MATIYKEKAGSRAALFHAHEACKYYAPEVIAVAKGLFAEGYGGNFGITLRTAKEATEAQLACAKKSYQKTSDPKSRPDFRVPSLCLQKQELIACTQDLASTVFKGDESDAKTECARRAPSVITAAKALFLGGQYGDSFRNICDVIETATPEQLECTRRDYEFITEGRTKYGGGFVLRGPCKGDPARIDCYFALMGVETKALQYNDRNRASIEDICGNATPESIALTRAMRGLGFNQWISSMLDVIRNAKPAQRECLKHLKAANVTDAEKADSSFRLPKACSK